MLLVASVIEFTKQHDKFVVGFQKAFDIKDQHKFDESLKCRHAKSHGSYLKKLEDNPPNGNQLCLIFF